MVERSFAQGRDARVLCCVLLKITFLIDSYHLVIDDRFTGMIESMFRLITLDVDQIVSTVAFVACIYNKSFVFSRSMLQVIITFSNAKTYDGGGFLKKL